jgi:hypothetical protein
VKIKKTIEKQPKERKMKKKQKYQFSNDHKHKLKNTTSIKKKIIEIKTKA